MTLTKIFINSFLSIWLAARAEANGNLSKEYQDWKIVPQVIDFAPSQLMIIEYHPMGIRGVHLGNMMTEEDVAKPPIEIYYDSHNKSTLHTLMMVDVDSPNPDDPNLRETEHMLIVNIPEANVAHGDLLAEYLPPSRWSSLVDGIHRFIYLVFEQSWKIKSENFIKIPGSQVSGRHKFRVKDFVQQHGLHNCIAGNFFTLNFSNHI